MAEVLLTPENPTKCSPLLNRTGPNKKRLNWLNWVRKSLGSIDRSNRTKACPCGFYHNCNQEGHDWPVFTMSQSGKKKKNFVFMKAIWNHFLEKFIPPSHPTCLLPLSQFLKFRSRGGWPKIFRGGS